MNETLTPQTDVECTETGIVKELVRVLREVKFSLNACQLIIHDPAARETVRDLVRQADSAIAKAEGK